MRVKLPLPGGRAVGLIDEMDGPPLEPMIKVDPPEGRPLVTTATLAVPAVASKLEGTTAVN